MLKLIAIMIQPRVGTQGQENPPVGWVFLRGCLGMYWQETENVASYTYKLQANSRSDEIKQLEQHELIHIDHHHEPLIDAKQRPAGSIYAIKSNIGEDIDHCYINTNSYISASMGSHGLWRMHSVHD